MEWIILGVIVLLTIANVPIGYALSVATILAILWTGAVSLSVVPLNLFSNLFLELLDVIFRQQMILFQFRAEQFDRIPLLILLNLGTGSVLARVRH